MGVKLKDLLNKYNGQPADGGGTTTIDLPAPESYQEPAEAQDDSGDESDDPDAGFVRTYERRHSSAIRHCVICGGKMKAGELMESVKSNGSTKWAHAKCADELGGKGSGVDREQVLAIAREADRELQSKLLQAFEPVNKQNQETLKILQAKIDELEKARKVIIELRQPDKPDVVIDEIMHEAFYRVIVLANLRKNIFLPGPAGCGKSHMAGQVAKALGLKFGFISCSAGMSESQLLGRRVPTGQSGAFEFIGTEFLDCYENGGVFLFDEIDAADSNVLLVINSALANGHMSVPNRNENPVAKKHKDFVCIAAANTFGRGADRQYVGRNQLDESTLDRFRIGTVPMDYNDRLERSLCPNEALYRRLVGYRKKVVDNKLERVVSTRFMKDAYEMVSQASWTMEQVDAQLFAGWRSDEITKVKGY